MASIKAFKAYRYTKQAGDINALVYPMSEKLSNGLVSQLQLNPNSAIHFSRSKGKPSKPYPELVKDWVQNKIIEKDHLDTLYVWYQYYADEDAPGKVAVRKGFTCQIRLEEWKDRIV